MVLWSYKALKLLPKMPDAIFIGQVVSQMAGLGRVSHVVNPA
jgi:hypothetical protein